VAAFYADLVERTHASLSPTNQNFKFQTHGGKQTIENVQMIQLAAKLWKDQKGFDEYGEKALKVRKTSSFGYLGHNYFLGVQN
jgi:hypothetical protein